MRRTSNLPNLFFPQICWSPRKVNASGFPSPRSARLNAATLALANAHGDWSHDREGVPMGLRPTEVPENAAGDVRDQWFAGCLQGSGSGPHLIRQSET